MAQYKFSFPEGHKLQGKNVLLLEKYQFIDGELHAEGKEARKMKPILCGFYKAQMEKVQDPNVESTVDTELEDEEVASNGPTDATGN